jgi:hypothetical protein
MDNGIGESSQRHSLLLKPSSLVVFIPLGFEYAFRAEHQNYLDSAMPETK